MAAPYPPGAPPTWAPPPVWTQPGMPPGPDVRNADLTGLSRVRLAALIAVVGSALGVALPLAFSFTGTFSFSVPAAGSAYTYSGTAIAFVIGTALVGLTLTLVSLWFYREGFLALRTVDGSFSSTPTFALLAVIGLVMVWAGLVLVLVELLTLLSCVTVGGVIPASCVALGGLLGGLALLLIGLILVLIGYIGTLVGIWRLGTRYGDSLFKIGAVLLIFPFLSVVGEILILVAASHAETRVRQAPPPAYAPSTAPFPPPPLH